VAVGLFNGCVTVSACWHVGQEKGLILQTIQEADKIIANLGDRE